MKNLIKKQYKALFSALAAGILFFPLFSSAGLFGSGLGENCGPASQGVPVPCGPGLFGAPAGAGTVTDFILLVINVLLIIIGLLTVLFIIIGGFRYVTAQGNEEQIESAKNTLKNSIIGLAIVILSFVIVRVIANALIFGSFGV